MKVPNAALLAWLEEELHRSGDERYWHRMLVERTESREAAVAVLKLIVQAAHEDARRYLREAFSDTLDPIEAPGLRDGAEGYPALLPRQTLYLYGYFGEVMAGIVAENFSPFGLRWEVPAYLFRFHIIAFQELERIRGGQAPTAALPGRTGDDCLAFVRSDGEIVAVLACEAKCTDGHAASMIAEAHEKVSRELRSPVDILQLIHVLLIL